MARLGISQPGQLAIVIRVVDLATAEFQKIVKGLTGLQATSIKTGGSLAGLAIQAGAFFTGLAAFNTAIKLGTEFNATIEVAKVGIAGVLASNNEFVNSLGQTAQGTDAVAAAMGEATKQVKLLQIAGLETVATTQQLVTAFQQAVAAGTAAGLTLEQIRVLTIGVVQAATALNMPTEQFNEEIRSLFEGTINIHSRVSRSLRITNEQIQRWKAQGPDVFFTEVHAKLEKFIASGAILANTWVVSWSNVKETLQVTLGQMFEPAMNRLKRFAQETQKSLLYVDKALAEVKIQPALETTFRVFGNMILDMADAAAKFGENITQALIDMGTWANQNAAAVNEVWEAFKSILAVVVEAIAGVVKLTAAVIKWGVESGLIRDLFTTIKDILQGCLDLLYKFGDVLKPFVRDLMEAYDWLARMNLAAGEFLDKWNRKPPSGRGAISPSREIEKLNEAVEVGLRTGQAGLGFIEKGYVEFANLLGMSIEQFGASMKKDGLTGADQIMAFGKSMQGMYSETWVEARKFWDEYVFGAEAAKQPTKEMTDLLTHNTGELKKQITHLGDLKAEQEGLNWATRMGLLENIELIGKATTSWGEFLEQQRKGVLPPKPKEISWADFQKAQRMHSRQQRETEIEYLMRPKIMPMTDVQRKAFDSYMRWMEERVGDYNARYLQLTGSTLGDEQREKVKFARAIEEEKAKLFAQGILLKEDMEKASESKMTSKEARIKALKEIEKAWEAFFKYINTKTEIEEKKKWVTVAELSLQGQEEINKRKEALLKKQYESDADLQRAHLIQLNRDAMKAAEDAAKAQRDIENKHAALRLAVHGSEQDKERQAAKENLQAEVDALNEWYNKRRAFVGESGEALEALNAEFLERDKTMRELHAQKTNDALLLIELRHQRAMAEARKAPHEDIAAIDRRIIEVENRNDPALRLANETRVNQQVSDDYRDFTRKQEALARGHLNLLAKLKGNEVEMARLSLEEELELQKQERMDMALEAERWLGEGSQAAIENWAKTYAEIDALAKAYAIESQRQQDLIVQQHKMAAAQINLTYADQYQTREQQIQAEIDALDKAWAIELLTLGKSLEEREAAWRLYHKKVLRLQQEATGSWLDGLARGLEDWLIKLETSFQLGEQLAKSFTDWMWDSVDAFLALSRDGFKDWEKTILKIFENLLAELQRFLARMLIINTLKLLFNSILNGVSPGAGAATSFSTSGITAAEGAVLPGGFTPITVPVTYAANGDVFNRPTFGIIGEAGPELILPLTKPERMKKLLQEVGLAYVTTKEYEKILQPATQDVIQQYASGGLMSKGFEPITQDVIQQYASGGLMSKGFEPITQDVIQQYASGGLMSKGFEPLTQKVIRQYVSGEMALKTINQDVLRQFAADGGSLGPVTQDIERQYASTEDFLEPLTQKITREYTEDKNMPGALEPIIQPIIQQTVDKAKQTELPPIMQPVLQYALSENGPIKRFGKGGILGAIDPGMALFKVGLGKQGGGGLLRKVMHTGMSPWPLKLFDERLTRGFAEGGYIQGAFRPIQVFAKGGILEGAFHPVKEFASGGVVDHPTFGMIAEGKYKEAVIPLPDGKTVQAHVTERDSGEKSVQPVVAAPQVIINVDNKSGLPVDLKKVSQRQDNQGQMIIDVVMTHLVTDPDFRAAIAGTR